MEITRRGMIGAAAAAGAGAALCPVRAKAQNQKTIRIGVLNDMSGPYRDLGGMGTVACVHQALKEFGPKGFPVEVISADHQNKADVGAGIARQWIDRDQVDMICDVNTSSVALAVNAVCKEKNTVFLDTGAATSDLTGKQCTPSTLHWSYDTYMLAKSTGGKTVKSGGNTWYFITADYVFGKQLQRDTTTFVTEAGGKVLGVSTYPFPGTTDFSSFLVAAQASGAKVLGLANAGADTVNSIKQAAEFGLTQKMTIAGLLMFIQDVHGLGLEAAQGLFLTESFYWDLNDRTRAFANRVRSTMPDKGYPNMSQAGDYAGTLHFLKVVQEMGVDQAKGQGAAIVTRMKAMPTEDDAFGKQHIREDGLFITPSFLFQVKKPSDSKGPWDYYTTVATTPADEAWEPTSKECSLVKS